MSTPRYRKSEEELLADLDRIFDQVEASFEQTQQRDLWEIRAHTSLWRDDLLADPYQLSHAIRSLISSSVDHMHAVRNLIRGSKVIHWAAPFTLLRGALETGCAALWLVSAAPRTERISRAIRLAIKDSADGYTTSEELGLPRKRSRAEQIALIEDVGIRAGADPASLRRLPSSTEIVKAASAYVEGGGAHGLAAWRICSGIAHGRTWSQLSFLDRTDVGRDAGEGTVLLELTAGEMQLVWVFDWALLILQRAAWLYQCRNEPLPEVIRR